MGGVAKEALALVVHSQVVIFASQKGGSGKTTLSGHLAVEAERAGAGPVALIDTDPQGSLAKWWNARAAETPLFVKTNSAHLGADIAALKAGGIRLIIVDTPPSVTTAIAETVSLADLVILPTRPSPHDLRAVGVTVDLVEAQRKPLLFVINSATARARITAETAVSLSQHGTVAPIKLHNRVDFAASMIDGRTVGEVDAKSRSAQEITQLWQYIAERLKRLRPVTDLSVEDFAEHFEVELLSPMRATEAKPAPAAVPVSTPTPAPTPVPDSGWIGAVPDHVMAEDEIEHEPALHPREHVTPVPQRQAVHQSPEQMWKGEDRRIKDRGPPSGFDDRRRVPVFGQRNAKSS